MKTEISELSLKSILGNKKVLLIFIISNFIVILITAVISVSLVSKKSDIDFIALINEDLEFSLAGLNEKAYSLQNEIYTNMVEMPGKYFEMSNDCSEIELSVNELIEYVEKLKQEIIVECGGSDPKYHNSPKNKNDVKIAQEILNSGIKSNKLNDMMLINLELLLGQIEDTSLISYKIVKGNLNYVNSLTKKYQELNYGLLFDDLPSIAVLNLLTQLQIKIRLAEIETLQYMLNYIVSMDMRITYFDSFIEPNKTILNIGETYTANIGMMAIDTTSIPVAYICHTAPFYDSVIIDGMTQYRLISNNAYQRLEANDEMKMFYNAKCNNPGKHIYGGLIQYRSNRGDVWLPFKGEYLVK